MTETEKESKDFATEREKILSEEFQRSDQGERQIIHSWPPMKMCVTKMQNKKRREKNFLKEFSLLTTRAEKYSQLSTHAGNEENISLKNH